VSPPPWRSRISATQRHEPQARFALRQGPTKQRDAPAVSCGRFNLGTCKSATRCIAPAKGSAAEVPSRTKAALRGQPSSVVVSPSAGLVQRALVWGTCQFHPAHGRTTTCCVRQARTTTTMTATRCLTSVLSASDSSSIRRCCSANRASCMHPNSVPYDTATSIAYRRARAVARLLSGFCVGDVLFKTG
jgi:hypothetical protein